MRSHAKDGAINETIILTALDNHRYKDLSENWKRHMSRMFKNIQDNDYIKVNYYSFKDAKPDLEIIVNNKKVLLSVKSGHNPQVHREQTYSFYDFLRKNGVPERLIKIISFYHFGHSFKQSENVTYTRNEIISKFSKYIKEVNDYFRNHDEIIRELIYRTIIRGRVKRDLIDYFYFGNASRGFLLSVSDIYKFISGDKNDFFQSICFKSLTYVAGSRQANDPQHHSVKIHWPILCKWFYDDDFMKRYG